MSAAPRSPNALPRTLGSTESAISASRGELRIPFPTRSLTRINNTCIAVCAMATSGRIDRRQRIPGDDERLSPLRAIGPPTARELEQRGGRPSRTFDRADESGARAKHRREKNRQERIDHLGRYVVEKAHRGEDVYVASEPAGRIVALGWFRRRHDLRIYHLRDSRPMPLLIRMTARAPAPADTSSTHKSLAAAHARLAARDDAILRAQIAVAQIAAPTGEEHERGGWVARRFRDCGLTEIETDDVGNVVARRSGTDDLPPVVICAHLDTVFPRGTDLSIRREGIASSARESTTTGAGSP